MGHARELSALAELARELEKESIQIQIAGMSAAILQGVPASTLDTDVWVNLPERSYVAVLAIVEKLGGTILARTVVALRDDTLVNFLYRVDGLKSFEHEFKAAKRFHLGGWKIAVLPLERIIVSKKFLKRPKDVAHLPLLEQVAKLRKPGRKPQS